MGKRNDVALKEKFRLWWEYFKRSDLCNRFQEKTVRLFKSKDEIKKTLRTAPGEEWFAASIEEVKRDKTISIHPLILFKELIEGFSIDEWWEMNIYVTNLIKPEVLDITTHATLITRFYKDHGDISTIIDPRPKTVDLNYNYHTVMAEEKDENIEIDQKKWPWGDIIPRPNLGHLFIYISGLLFWDNNQLEKEIRKIIKNRKGEIKSIFVLSEKPHYNKLAHYLDVYDRVKLFKGKHFIWEKIRKEFYPGLTKRATRKNLPPEEVDRIHNKLENNERLLKMKWRKAKKIIANTERGIFPGRY